MNLLLDTVTIMRIALDESLLSAVAVDAYRDPSNSLFISVVSIWEILVKNKLGKLPLPMPLHDLLEPIQAATKMQVLPLKESAAYRVASLPDLHRDPFDRLLICQALDESLTILTPDAEIKAYPVAVIW